MRKPLIAGNWKMNGLRHQVACWLQALRAGSETRCEAELVVFPPFVHLPACEEVLMQSAIAWGAQDVSAHESGAYTGEVSAKMIKEWGCTYVIVGHSERRRLHHETNEAVAAKALAVLAVGLRPIVCVGETLTEREAGRTEAVVTEQLAALLDLADNAAGLSGVVVAYEPVWAIGTGKAASPETAEVVHQVIRARLAQKDAHLAQATRVLYGGSVNQETAPTLLVQPNIDGLLIGGASLDPAVFLSIGKLCNRSSLSCT